MKCNEARAKFNVDFQEVSVDNYLEPEDDYIIKVNCADGILFFKEKEKFPKVFKSKTRIFRVKSDGEIDVYNEENIYITTVSQSLPELYKAVEESKRIKGLE